MARGLLKDLMIRLPSYGKIFISVHTGRLNPLTEDREGRKGEKKKRPMRLLDKKKGKGKYCRIYKS